jgi:hypothetical protein
MGLRDLPSALSITWLVLVVPTTCKCSYTRCVYVNGVLVDTWSVSEPIGLEIVAFNGGSYTGAILFTGWMYIGAAVFLWLVRTWKLGEMEEEGAMGGKSEVDAVAGSFQKSSFVKRMFMWRKV